MHAKIYQLAASALAKVDKKKAAGVAAGLVASLAADRGHAGMRRAAAVAAATLNNDVGSGSNAHAAKPTGKAAAPHPAAASPAAPDPAVTAAMLASAHAQANSLARRIYTPW